MPGRGVARITDSTHSNPMTRWSPSVRGIAAVPWEGPVLRRYLTLGAVALAVLPGAAYAQTKLEARYAVTLAGIPLGAGTWVIDIAADQYTAVASGRTTGLVKLVSDGSGMTGSK